MSKTRVPRAVVFCVLSALMVAFTLHVYLLKELKAALLFFSVFFWAMIMTLFIFMVLAAASWNAITWLTALAARLGAHLRTRSFDRQQPAVRTIDNDTRVPELLTERGCHGISAAN